MENAGVVGGNEVFKDVETGTRWQQSSLEAIDGPLKGDHLELYPFLLTSWEEWLRLHPDTLVLKPMPGYTLRLHRSGANTAGFRLPAKGLYRVLPIKKAISGLRYRK